MKNKDYKIPNLLFNAVVLRQFLGEAVAHLEKDEAICDGRLSIMLTVWTDGFD